MANKLDPIAFHDSLAKSWDNRYDRGGFARRAHFFARDILPLLPQDGYWLDVGCGTGTFSRMLVKNGHRVMGVDGSASMLAEARGRAADLAHRLSFQQVGTVESLSFPSRHFDGVICLSVLEYLAQPLEALKEMCRVLKPGGTMVFSVPHRRSALRAMQKIYERLQPQRFHGNIRYLKLSGFSTISSEIDEAVMSYGMRIRTIVGFDPILPRPLHVLLKPSLIYVVCEKQQQN